jgi:hypothetical protein
VASLTTRWAAGWARRRPGRAGAPRARRRRTRRRARSPRRGGQGGAWQLGGGTRGLGRPSRGGTGARTAGAPGRRATPRPRERTAPAHRCAGRVARVRGDHAGPARLSCRDAPRAATGARSPHPAVAPRRPAMFAPVIRHLPRRRTRPGPTDTS